MTEMLARLDPAFDGPVILFQDVIEILHRSVVTVFLQSSFGLKLDNGWWVSNTSL
jgi:hypothetical protein